MGEKRKPKAKAKRKPVRRPAPENVWDRQEDESVQAYAAFRDYLLLGPERSTAKVARRLGKSKTLIDRWSSRNRWVARVEAFDAEAAKRVDDAVMDELERRNRRQAELATLALEAMAAPSIELMRRIQNNPELLKELSTDDLLKAAATTARAMPRVQQSERLARGQSTSNVGGHRGGPLEVSDNRSVRARSDAERRVADMPDEALEAFLSGAETQRQLSEREKRKAEA